MRPGASIHPPISAATEKCGDNLARRSDIAWPLYCEDRGIQRPHLDTSDGVYGLVGLHE